jgi:transposase InsO family protein
MGGRLIKTRGKARVESMVVEGLELGPRMVQIMQSLPMEVDVIVGLDIVLQYGLVVGSNESRVMVQFGNKIGERSDAQAAFVSVKGHQREERIGKVEQSASAGRLSQMEQTVGGVIEVHDTDFHASFDQGRWTAAWRWKGNEPPRVCGKPRPNYKVPEEDIGEFREEVGKWIEEGILVPWVEEVHGEVKNILPLMSVSQTKGKQRKIRPVLDFSVLNSSVMSLVGQAMPSCQDSLREWRVKGESGAIVDLKRAYMQIHMERELWVYQAVRWEGRVFLLTRLGFGLNVAPKIMTSIVQKVLSLDGSVNSVTSSYADDIHVAGDGRKVSQVRGHLQKFGLQSKDAEQLGCKEGVRVLGLRVSQQFTWSRDSSLPRLSTQVLTRRELHGWVGELISHFPVASWMRVYCGYLQRCTAEEGIGWDEKVSAETWGKANEMDSKLRDEGDPVRGYWPVDLTQPAVMWVDASSLAMGVVLEIGGKVVEDAAWLRGVDDTKHINMAELQAAVLGVNMCVRWGVKQFTLKTDSATVFGWLKSIFERTHRAKTRALYEWLVRRRLDILSELVAQEDLQVVVEQVPSAKNKADVLTRVPKKWLTARAGSGVSLAAAAVDGEDAQEMARIHNHHHFGVDRTLELARKKMGSRATRQLAKSVISNCKQCASIDPAVTFRWQKGKIAQGAVWQQLSIDITHVGGKPYLSCIDGASHFTIWRELRSESAKEVCAHLLRIFTDMGPPETLLSDNAASFHSTELRQLMENWGVAADFSCAYRAQGNGIIERVHRTIKRMVARSGRGVEEMTFWYNATKGDRPASPHEMVFGATPRMPGVTEQRQEVRRNWPTTPNVSDDTRADLEKNPFTVGDLVYLKRDSRCDRPWSGPHRVTSVESSVGAVVDNDGFSRHVSHLRRVPMDRTRPAVAMTHDVRDDEGSLAGDDSSDDDVTGQLQRIGGAEEVTGLLRSSTRKREPPDRWADSYSIYYKK